MVMLLNLAEHKKHGEPLRVSSFPDTLQSVFPLSFLPDSCVARVPGSTNSGQNSVSARLTFFVELAMGYNSVYIGFMFYSGLGRP